MYIYNGHHNERRPGEFWRILGRDSSRKKVQRNEAMFNVFIAVRRHADSRSVVSTDLPRGREMVGIVGNYKTVSLGACGWHCVTRSPLPLALVGAR